MTGLPAAIGRYQVRDRIGQGGMGVLYLALDPAIDRLVAIKLLSVNSHELRERFAREARSAGRLQHPNIVTIYDVGEHDGQPFIAMEYISGETLASIVQRRASIALQRRIAWVEALCDGLAYAHRFDIVHRDIKPANLMVSREGVLKILDFGIARVSESGQTQVGMILGTPNYMSPEQVEGRPVDRRSDIFSVGLVLYELCSFRKAFGGSGLTALRRVVDEAPPPLSTLVPDLDPEVTRIVSVAVQKAPEKRYQDMLAMRGDLERVRLRMTESAVEATLVPAFLPQAPAPRTADRVALAQRRSAQIEACVARADLALAAGDLDAAALAAEDAAFIDPDDARAVAALDRVRAAVDANQARACVKQAAQKIDEGALTEAFTLVVRALALDAASGDARQLKERLDELRRERERAAAVARLLAEAVARARTHLEAGEYDAAIEAAEEAIELGSDDGIAADLLRRATGAKVERDRREERERRATAAIDAARRRFEGGEMTEAIADLERFDPHHERVAAAVEALRASAAAREHEQRQAAEARRARAAAVAGQIAAGRAAIRDERFDEARDILESIESMPDLDGEERVEVRQVAIEFAAAAAEERRRRTDRHAVVKDAAPARGDDLTTVGSLASAALAESRGHLEGGRLDAADERARAALGLDPQSDAAVALLQEIASARRAAEDAALKARQDRAARAAIDEARAAFDAGRHAEALRRLDLFRPPHDLVTAARAAMQADIDAPARARSRAARPAAKAVRQPRPQDGQARGRTPAQTPGGSRVDWRGELNAWISRTVALVRRWSARGAVAPPGAPTALASSRLRLAAVAGILAVVLGAVLWWARAGRPSSDPAGAEAIVAGRVESGPVSDAGLDAGTRTGDSAQAADTARSNNDAGPTSTGGTGPAPSGDQSTGTPETGDRALDAKSTAPPEAPAEVPAITPAMTARRRTEQAAAQAAMDRVLAAYATAYKTFDADALVAVYPRISRARQDTLKRLEQDCAAYDVRFLNPRLVAFDASSAGVRTTTVYSCRRADGTVRESTVGDAFSLQRTADGDWIIARM
jgi:tetratricopeptide (TPR) repeat protein/predicted Ser/Thr protein kinase